ncbi:MAG: DUF998 domain-containing protein [Desulfurococcaceae archaeon]
MQAKWFLNLWRFTGVLAVILAWIVIAISITYNPWFDLFKHALSDLGDPGMANNPWIYNTGLIVTGVVTCIYSLYLAYRSINKVHVFASALIFVAGIFLSLIGVFPSGTRPHVFISTWFFIQIWLAMLATSIGMASESKTPHAMSLAILAITGPIGAFIVKWPSVALLEIYGIVIINIYIVLLTRNF